MTSRREMTADENASGDGRGEDPRGAGMSEGGMSQAEMSAPGPDDEALIKLTGTMKWFDATRGFGFLVSEQAKGDVLVHFSVLKEHDRRSLPEGAIVECLVVEQERGFQARKVLTIDLSTAVVPEPARPVAGGGGRIDAPSLLDDVGGFLERRSA